MVDQDFDGSNPFPKIQTKKITPSSSMPSSKDQKRNRNEYDSEYSESDQEEEGQDNPKTKQVKTTASLGIWKEDTSQELYYFIHHKFSEMKFPKDTVGVASFDFDSTLVLTKSGKQFATNANDWKLFHKNVSTKLIDEVKKKNRLLVIFTNQNGIKKGKLTKKDLEKRMEGFIRQAVGEDIPVLVLAAMGENSQRKPCTGMWTYLEEKILPYHKELSLDKSDSFYVGDAAGRPERKDAEKKKIKKDHSCGDRKFAMNLGIKFHTPENYFLGEAEYPTWSLDGYDIKKFENAKLTPYKQEDLISSKQEIVIFQGWPASGKTTFAKRYFLPAGYVHVNRDSLSTPAKCIKATKEAIAQGKSVVVDNTNPDSASRKPYIEIAEENDIPCRCFVFDIERELAEHLNVLRENRSNGAHPHVPGVAYNTYNKKFEDVTKDEGLTEVRKIKFIPVFNNDREKEEFFMYT